ncbi:MAG: T9SS type A sorting domain-containing protein [Sphingobacteriales bacterium]|nr:MAG: T9SS type A sorting domain-containing protein [Sphingobacteriales bacterium]
MKYLFLLSFTLFYASNTEAQITLTNTSYQYPNPSGGNDSFRLAAKLNTVPALPIVINGWWDFSKTDFNPYYGTLGGKADTNLSFPEATFIVQPSSDGYNMGLGGAPALLCGTFKGYGYMQYGLEMYPEVSWIGYNTSVNTDSVWTPYQNIAFSVPDTAIKFPATYSTTWKNNYKAIYKFTVSISPHSVVKAPAERRVHTSRTDSVVGYGKMIVPNHKFGVSDTFNVLQVMTKTFKIDSLYVSGVAATPGMVNALYRRKQGQRDTFYTLRYFRAGEMHPLTEAEFKTNTYSNTDLKKLTIHQSRLKPVSVRDAYKAQGVKIFPNPVTGRMLTVEVENDNHNWSYEVINMMGQTIAKASILSKQQAIRIDDTHPSGIYYIRLNSGNTNETIIKAIDITD